MQHYRQEQYDAFYAATSAPAGSLGQVVFIRGFMSPSWVSAMGSKYNIDPEFFRRHGLSLREYPGMHIASRPLRAPQTTYSGFVSAPFSQGRLRQAGSPVAAVKPVHWACSL